MKKLFKNFYLFALLFLSVIIFFVIRTVTDSYLWGFIALVIGVLFFGGLFRIIDIAIKKRKKNKQKNATDETNATNGDEGICP